MSHPVAPVLGGYLIVLKSSRLSTIGDLGERSSFSNTHPREVRANAGQAFGSKYYGATSAGHSDHNSD